MNIASISGPWNNILSLLEQLPPIYCEMGGVLWWWWEQPRRATQAQADDIAATPPPSRYIIITTIYSTKQIDVDMYCNMELFVERSTGSSIPWSDTEGVIFTPSTEPMECMQLDTHDDLTAMPEQTRGHSDYEASLPSRLGTRSLSTVDIRLSSAAAQP